MAVTPIIVTSGIRKMQAQLRAMNPDMARETRVVVKEAVQPMVRTARDQGHKRRQTGELGDRWHARMRGATATLSNTLPQVGPHEFGGTIAPRGVPITFEAAHMVYGPGGAIAEGKKEAERRLLVGFGAFAGRHGFS